ncbi:MAG: CpsB/CapC family capsule biosynthesis tyrosine phosphatase [Planctomycetota bacterium]
MNHDAGYIDLHCHVLPQVDDGVQFVSEAVETILGLQELGIRKFIATPHHTASRGRPPYSLWVDALYQLVRAMPHEWTGEIEIAAENLLTKKDLPLFFSLSEFFPKEAPVARAFLVEVPQRTSIEDLCQIILPVKAAGAMPLVAHPERYPAISIPDLSTPELPLCKLLVSLTSLGGYYGHDTEMRAMDLVAELWEQVPARLCVATDAHGPEALPYIETGLDVLEQLIGYPGVVQTFSTNPASILGDNQ